MIISCLISQYQPTLLLSYSQTTLHYTMLTATNHRENQNSPSDIPLVNIGCSPSLGPMFAKFVCKDDSLSGCPIVNSAIQINNIRANALGTPTKFSDL
mmetsp:Transcript_47695/g.101375  ORF Transcript_47695/g.101375 Transcript_47695/m.101375 type:complete len:98 (-) Transcript_47695:353-646(-)